ncbi:helix-turn-helix domain-containing protein [Streptomyces sp. S.PNR 29]|uniref:helix-turn-helix domain-containing protein n=1 Tax=Streptomyces sp. S.PNR 29 TaxID=2973805 RepID=UPI0025B1188A|nr:helix-turn-helix domain-containing protein [Streptomyces sp. S.PNR 29]MDN0197977.1 helix-turn-helix domain-containing protein [Streptomyces sp. S.PNR 29]
MDFDAVDALLASVTVDDGLPTPAERKELRRTARLSQAQVAQAVGVSRETVSAWETGRWEPTGDARTKYRRLLHGLKTKLSHPAPPHPTPSSTTNHPPHSDPDHLPTPAPCVLCGAPATHHVEGYPQHLDPADCAPTAPHLSSPQPSPTPTTHPDPTPTPARRRSPQKTANPIAELIPTTVHDTLAAAGGDLTAATAELQRRAIPDAMALLDACRIGARYDIVGHPPLPTILRKKSAHGADDVWEARPNWTRLDPPSSGGQVTALDINGAYLSALKTHLPLGALEHSTGNVHSRRRAGIHLITPPEWDHHPCLPNPMGSREEPGPVWVTEPTLRLLQRLSTAQYGPLCEPPVIHESWTSGATEQLFEKFRQILRDAREKAITENDEVTLEYVKSMYSKFVSTMGESNFNRAIYRPDWMHIIRSQAFVNLWLKAYKAHTAGLAVMRVMGTDELHIAGEWQHVFTEGRGVSQVKVKDVYTLPTAER